MKGSIKTKLDEKAYRRDRYRCMECGKSTGIEAHHIIPDLEELDNLVTLCHSCHKKKHNMAGCFKNGHVGYKTNVKLRSEDVKLIKKILESDVYMTHLAISKMFNIGRSTINDIANRKTWTDI